MNACQTMAAHQPFHPAATNRQPPAQDQLGVHPPRAVGPPSHPVDVDDQIEQVSVADITG
jgi:hypothetical protein